MVEFLYVHIPFCLSKCPYCSFHSFPEKDDSLHLQYIKSLHQELKYKKRQGKLRGKMKSLFLGGGTPSILSIENLGMLFKVIQSEVDFTKDAEISIEVNPKTGIEKKISTLKSYGVNRISIGVQSFNDNDLMLLQRSYDGMDAKRCIETVYGSGIDNISIDLMYGLPNQSVKRWQENLSEGVLDTVQHLSIYQLTIEENTPFAKDLREKRFLLPSEDDIDLMDSHTRDILTVKGFERYEISNYSKKNQMCRHNVNYWENKEYIGLGAGAVGYEDSVRYWNEKNVSRYTDLVANSGSGQVSTEILEKDHTFRETVVIGLRMTKGVNIDQLHERFGIDVFEYYGNTVSTLIAQGLLKQKNNNVHLTDRGMDLANSVMAELV